MERLWIGAGALLGLGTVAMAAAAAHGLAARLDPAALAAVHSGVQMQGWHALALVLCGVWSAQGGVLAHAAAGCFLAGLILFCGGIYGGALAGLHLRMMAPAGGTLLMLGWGFLALSALTARRR